MTRRAATQPPTRRAVLQASAGLAAAVAVPALWSQAAPPPRTIAIVAQRFAYSPTQITLQAGERVVLAVTSKDFDHGLSIPTLGLRIDLVPDRVVTLELPPLQPGRYGFLCDNFCGESHEDMHGQLVVEAAA